MEDKIKGVLKVVGACLVFAVLGFLVGRYSAPQKVIERESVKIQKVETQVVAVQEKVRVEKVYVSDTKQSIHREEHTTEHPNGLKETFKSEDINTEKVVKQHDIQYVDRDVVKYVENKVVEQKLVEKIVESSKPQWHASVLAGTPLSLSPSLTVGASVQRRMVGPFYLGAWAHTTTRLETPTAGLSVGFEW